MRSTRVLRFHPIRQRTETNPSIKQVLQRNQKDRSQKDIDGLRWIPTGKIFTSSTTKVDSEPTNGSDEDITNQYEYEQTLNVSACTLNLSAASPAVESFVNSFEMLKNQENNKSKSDKGYHAVPLPYIGDFMLCKPDLTFMDEIVKSENLDVTIVVTPSNVRQSGKINTASASVNTAVRQVNIANSKTTVNHPRPISNAYKKGYSQVTKPFNKYSANKNSIFNKKVNTVRVKDTTAKDRAVVSENKGKGANVVKASACWVWKAKNSSASNTFKKYSYIDARGRSKSIMAWIPKRV
ncbi:hypothetical protein Tco_1406705 [Tanacetum coccineum]